MLVTRETKKKYKQKATYATEKQIQRIVCDHAKSIRALCYIHHDQDESEPHYHILMRTHSNWTTTQITKWFADLKDKEKNKSIRQSMRMRLSF